MTNLILELPPSASADTLGDALMESRSRWQHLVRLSADVAFETDSSGHFVFLAPDTVLGWPVDALIGQPLDILIPDATFNPTQDVRRQPTCLRSHDGTLATMVLSTTVLRNSDGNIIGMRGIGTRLTDRTVQPLLNTAVDALSGLLVRVAQETEADAMLDAAFWALIHACAADAAALIGNLSGDAPIQVLHECGPGAAAVLPIVARQLTQDSVPSSQASGPDGQPLLIASCLPRSGAQAAVAIWRKGRPWDQTETQLAEATASVVRLILNYDALADTMARQQRADPLTGLLNRRAFLQETQRDAARLDRENAAGTLMCIGIDAFKTINETLGHAAGDDVLKRMADLLRNLVRPFDLLARLGGDVFAIWMAGADHMTAAERADYLCSTAPDELRKPLPNPFPDLGVSIGIAARRAGSQEPIDTLLRRADMAMYEVKRTGRRHWRVSLQEGN